MENMDHFKTIIWLYCVWCSLTLVKSNVIRVPKNCDKSSFVKSFVVTGTALTHNAYKNLRNTCKTYQPKCEHTAAKNFWLTLAHNPAQKKIIFILELENLFPQECWGYVLQISQLSSKTETRYFNFTTNDSLQTKKNLFTTVDISYGEEYNFQFTPLPTGRPLVINARAPTICELDVLVQIYDLLHKSKIFKKCSKPGYMARLRIAKRICLLHPTDKTKRREYVARKLMERKCRFELRT
ncbi:uncharacterized protein [Clytia hemisphaerica]|uniref:Cnidarian restricted protein n=1 Tax=Clytia hemisphaerica TaxID=252671 RepID=A0A7M5WXX8_9CNID